MITLGKSHDLYPLAKVASISDPLLSGFTQTPNYDYPGHSNFIPWDFGDSTTQESVSESISDSSSSSHYHTAESSCEIPSLLSLSLSKPDNLNDETLAFVRHNHRSNCWKCDAPGHYYAECQSTVRRTFCKDCGKPGFTKNQCPDCERELQFTFEAHKQ